MIVENDILRGGKMSNIYIYILIWIYFDVRLLRNIIKKCKFNNEKKKSSLKIEMLYPNEKNVWYLLAFLFVFTMYSSLWNEREYIIEDSVKLIYCILQVGFGIAIFINAYLDITAHIAITAYRIFVPYFIVENNGLVMYRINNNCNKYTLEIHNSRDNKWLNFDINDNLDKLGDLEKMLEQYYIPLD